MIFRRDVKHRIAKKLLLNAPNNHFLPYPYQLDLLDTACERNTIMCLSNELTKNFIVLSLIREMHHDQCGKRVIYFTQDRNIQEVTSCLSRHTGRRIGSFSYNKPFIDWTFFQWTQELLRYEVIVISPWLIPSLVCGDDGINFQKFLFHNFYLLVVSECHHTLDSNHPYAQLFLHVHTRQPDTIQSACDAHFRIICFTSSLLPREFTDPVQAEERLCKLESLTGCLLETASELLTMLSLGARPKEHIISYGSYDTVDCTLYTFVSRILAETHEFLTDIQPHTPFKSDKDGNDKLIDPRGRVAIPVLDYCRRAVEKCMDMLPELGVWCAAQIARVFVKHLVRLDARRPRQQRGNENMEEPWDSQIYRLLHFTITQLTMIVRLAQTEFDTCMTLEQFQTMVSPKVLTLVEQLKVYKPTTDFRIEVAELADPVYSPAATGSSLGGRKRNRRRGSRRSSAGGSTGDAPAKPSTTTISLLSSEPTASSGSSSDTMSSSMSDSTEDRRESGSSSCSSRRSSASRGVSGKTGASASRRKSKGSTTMTLHKTQDLHFVPAATLLTHGGLEPELDPSRLVYRAVLLPGPDGKTPSPQPTTARLCGLILVSCQFTAYALSRLVDELCIWDVDLFFVKPAHLFSQRIITAGGGGLGDEEDGSETTGEVASSSAAQDRATRGDGGGGCAARQTALRTGDETVAAPHGYRSAAETTLPATQEETIAKFRRGLVNLLVATQPAISAAAGGAELPRCNLVLALQAPHSLAEYLSSKARSRLVDHGAQVVYLAPVTSSTDDANTQTNTHLALDRLQKLELLLVQRCRGYQLFADEHEVEPAVCDRVLPPLLPKGPNGPKLSLSKAINVINQYCARLPSDYITNLTPRWRLQLVPTPATDWSPLEHGAGATCGQLGEVEHAHQQGLYQCFLRLPINASLKQEIAGEPMACKKLAKLSAALNAIRALYTAGDLDSRWELSSKTTTISDRMSRIALTSGSRNQSSSSPISNSRAASETESDASDVMATGNSSSYATNSLLDGSSHRRQYYYRKVANQMHNCLPRSISPSPNYLYFIDMQLVSPVPDRQNSRGRPYFRPELEPLGFGLLTTKPLHNVPIFPIFSRSGEESVRLVELWSPDASLDTQQTLPIPSPVLTQNQLDQLIQFHRIVFQAVLHLEREALIEFKLDRAYSQVLVVPVRKDTLDIDWPFLQLTLSSHTADGVCRLPPRRCELTTIADSNSNTPSSATSKPVPRTSSVTSPPRGARPTGRARASLRARQLTSKTNPLLSLPSVFEFRPDDFLNAVVMPGYRNLDQPQHYYVAEIRSDLSPLSPFPSAAYPDFAAYYTNKYDVSLTTMDQPLLDVDYTVLRLNLLMPRYMNVRGHSLPCSTEARKLARRENLTHKQILIPELCFRHPFPASVWRKAVCLPSVLHRLHSLLIAEELRHRIAQETNLGVANLPPPRPISRSQFVQGHLDMTLDDVFEPLRLVFPIQTVAEDDGPTVTVDRSSSAVGAGRRRQQQQRRRRRGVKGQQDSDDVSNANGSKRDSSNHLPQPDGDTQREENDLEEEEADDDDDANDKKEAGRDDSMVVDANCRKKPNSDAELVKLHATPGSSRGGGVTSSTLESMLEETKVIEFDDLDSSERIDYDQEDVLDTENLLPVINRDNMDPVFDTYESDSDTTSVDSFEGNVRFFPSEDDDDTDAEEESVECHQQSTFTGENGPKTQCNGGVMDCSPKNRPDPYNSIGSRVTKASRTFCPGPANVLQALTMSRANDFLHLERMETIGDSFLKFVATVHLYLTYPNAHEGKLSHLRSRLVSNSNLYRLGRMKQLPDRMIGSKFSPFENWVPPGYVVRQDPRLLTLRHTPSRMVSGRTSNPQSPDSPGSERPPQVRQKPTVELNIWSTDTLMDDEVLLGTTQWDETAVKPIDNFAITEWDPVAPEVSQMQHRMDHCLVTIQQTIPDKSVADCVEALIGCYLTGRGERSALRLMRWFGIDCLPADPTLLRPHGAPWAPPPRAIPVGDPQEALLEDARLAWHFNVLEEKLQYKFRDPALLIQAFTHPSYHQLRRTIPRQTRIVDIDTAGTSNPPFLTDTDCYQRLEFLGDAVLDYVITRFLYEDSQQHSPGVLTDLRSALVNNNIFAALAVRADLHQYLRASSPQLLYTMDQFVRYQKEVVNDDLDFITNEDIEIRQPDCIDPLSEEATHSLANATQSLDVVPQSVPVRVASPIHAHPTQPRSINSSHSDVDADDEVSSMHDTTADDSHHLALMASNEAVERESEQCRKQEDLLLGDLVTSKSDAQTEPPAAVETSAQKPPQGRVPGRVADGGCTTNRACDDVEIPKALGDIFESLAGAIFLDSDLDLNTVWNVFYPLMKERIERYTACIPKSPVRQLLELEPEGTKFGRPRRTADGRISVCAHVLGKGRFFGIGRNYRLAKSLAAKRALRVLRKLQAVHAAQSKESSHT